MMKTIRGAVPALTLGLTAFAIGSAAVTFAQNAPLELAPGSPQVRTAQPTDAELLKKKPTAKPATSKPAAKPATAATPDKVKLAAKPPATKPVAAPKKPVSLEALTAQAAVPPHEHVSVDVPPGSCPGNPDAIGLSRTIEVDTTGGFYVGQTYHTKMPLLQPKEVILTFDDGPRPGTTDRVLAALQHECVKATFFMIGQMAKAYPAEARKVAAAGMSIGYHTMTHTYQLKNWPLDKSQAEIVGGWKAVDEAIWGHAGDKPTALFFRYPGLFNSHVVNAWFNQINMGVFAIDAAGNDWIKGYITDAEAPNVMNRALSELEHQNGGILLLHDIKGSSSNAVAPLLRELKARGFKIVHVVQKLQPLPPPAAGPAPVGSVDTQPAPIAERNITGFDVSRQLGQEQLGKVGAPSDKPAPLPAYKPPVQQAEPTTTNTIAANTHVVATPPAAAQPMPAAAPKQDDGWFGSTASVFRGIGTAIGLW